jgi:hypothetical protein
VACGLEPPAPHAPVRKMARARRFVGPAVPVVPTGSLVRVAITKLVPMRS